MVDNGYVGTDANGNLVARTASIPYPCISMGGTYLVSRHPGAKPGEVVAIRIESGDAGIFGDLGFSLGGASSWLNMAGLISPLGTMVTMLRYSIGMPQVTQVEVKPQPAQALALNLSTALPAAKTVWGNVVLPNITEIKYESAQTDKPLKIAISNANPGEFVGQLVVRAIFDDGTGRDVATFNGDSTGTLNLDAPTDFPIGSVTWQIVRRLPFDTLTSQGKLKTGDPVDFAGNTARIVLKHDLIASLTNKGVAFYRENSNLNEVNLLGAMEGSNTYDGKPLNGFKVQPIAFSIDGSRAYIAGKGVVWVVDTVSFKVVQTIDLTPKPAALIEGETPPPPPSPRNIASVVTYGNFLLIAESGPGARLQAINIAPGSDNYHKNPITLQWSGDVKAVGGFAGLAIGPDGKTLVVAAPKGSNSPALFPSPPRPQGDVLIFDLSSLDIRTGQIDTPVVAKLPSGAVKTPQTISATKNPDQFLVSSPNDTRNGLSTLTLKRDGTGKVVDSSMKAINMIQPTDLLKADRLDIQRAQSAVLAEKNGVQYAIVADDNYYLNDPYVRDMYSEAVLIGGQAPTKIVNVGGKLGVIKDPFGEAKFMGATKPFDGYGFANLSLSADGKLISASLRGRFGVALDSPWRESMSGVWNVDEIIAAAENMPEKDRWSKALTLDTAAIKEKEKDNPWYSFLTKKAEETVQWVDSTAGTVVGTVGAGVSSLVSMVGSFLQSNADGFKINGRYGDVIGVNLREQVARNLLGFTKPTESLSANERQVLLKKMEKLTINLSSQTVDEFAGTTLPLELLVERDKSGNILLDEKKRPTILSRNEVAGTTLSTFEKSSVLYFLPRISATELQTLRKGGTLPTRGAQFSFKYKESDGELFKDAWIELSVADYAQNRSVYFGDRPLDNPGYSSFNLNGGVAEGNENDPLNVYRVEQRLAYLGFPAIGSPGDNTLKEFVVDGVFGAPETRALKLFEKTVRYAGSPHLNIIKIR